MYKKNLAVILAGILFFAAGFLNAQQDKKLVTPEEAYNLIKKDSSIVLLDVRTPDEFKSETGHLKGAILIPVQELGDRLDEIQKFKKRQVIVYCRTGHRSTGAAEILSDNGFKVYNMEGGITRWNSEKLPIVKESK